MKHETMSHRAASASQLITFLALMSCLCFNLVKLPWRASAAWAGNPIGDSENHMENARHASAESIGAQGVGEHVRLVNHVGGASGPIVIQGSYAYMSFSFELAVMDISDPTHPTRIGFLTLPYNIRWLCAYGDYVFAAGRSNLAIIDASIPTNPVHVGSFRFQDYPTGLAANGTHIYLSARPSIRIIDYTNPALPVQVADYTPPGNPGDLYVRDRYLYSAEGGDGLPVPQIWGGMRILDISDPRAPQEVSYSVTARIAADVVLVDSLAYVADYYSGLWIFDISNPYEPVKLGYTQIGGGGAGNLAVVGGTAYVTSWDGVAIVDVNDSTAPRVIGSYASGGIVAAVPGIVYLGGSSMLEVVDVSDPTQAVLVRTIGGLRWADGLDVRGSYIYVAEPRLGMYEPENLPGLWILDNSEPSQVQVTGFFSDWCAGGGTTLEVSGQNAFMACKSGVLQVFDIADPYFPVKLGNAGFGGNAIDIALNGSYTYVISGDYESGLWIFDISNPATPELMSSYSIQFANSVVAGDPYVYVASGDGLLVFDPTQPTNPVLLNRLDGYDGIRLALTGQTLFMTGSRCDGSCDQGLYVFDISDPAAPELTGYFPTSSPPVGLDVAGQLAAISIQNYSTEDYGGELFVLSMADPNDPY